MELVVGISGASGVIYGIRMLEALRDCAVKTNLIISPAGRETIRLETDYKLRDVEAMATYNHSFKDIAAPLSSGSYKTSGMVIIPCSMKTLAGISHGYADNLILRAAEVTLKERRPLVLVPRESPLTLIHMRNMLLAARAGAIILPAMPGFYHRPKTLQDLVDHVVGKVLDILDIEHNLYARWTGPPRAEPSLLLRE